MSPIANPSLRIAPKITAIAAPSGKFNNVINGAISAVIKSIKPNQDKKPATKQMPMKRGKAVVINSLITSNISLSANLIFGGCKNPRFSKLVDIDARLCDLLVVSSRYKHVVSPRNSKYGNAKYGSPAAENTAIVAGS